MKRLRALLITALIIVLGTSTAFADIVSIPRMVYNAKWYIVAAIVVLIIVISLLRSAIRRRSEKNEAEMEYNRYENAEMLQPVGSVPEPEPDAANADISDSTSDEQ